MLTVVKNAVLFKDGMPRNLSIQILIRHHTNKNMNRITTQALAFVFVSTLGVAHALEFPAKPVRIVVAITAGSSMDIIARIIAQRLAESWSQPVIVDNRSGAGGNVGGELVAKAAPDGYTLLFFSSGLAISPSIYRKLPFDPARDLEPVTQVSSLPKVLLGNLQLPANSVKELIALARAKPGQINFGSGGTGSSDHMAGELLKFMARIDMVHVPYRGGSQLVSDTINGNVAVSFMGIPVALPMIKMGKLKALGTTGTKRSTALPNVPTIAEAGLLGYEVNVWYGMLAPHGTLPTIVTKIADAVSRVVNLPDVQERFRSIGVEPDGTTPAAFKQTFASDLKKWANVVKFARIQVE